MVSMMGPPPPPNSSQGRSVPTNEEHFIDLVQRLVPDDHFFHPQSMLNLLDKYSEKQLGALVKDYKELYKLHFENAHKLKECIVTAGGPCNGKSTLLEKEIAQKGYVYIDPDRTCLANMEHTDGKDNGTPEERYTLWREASNFFANLFLYIALKEGYAIAHDSTMATPSAVNALSSIRKKYGYNVTILHVSADEEVRKWSKEYRLSNDGVYQVTDKDFAEKNALFYTLLEDYMENSDKMFFYYRGTMDRMVLAAKKLANSPLKVVNEKALSFVKELHPPKLQSQLTVEKKG